MKFNRLAIGLHCYSLEDFPVDHTGSDADSLLCCWTALWHPQLIAATGNLPTWVRLGDPIQPLDGQTSHASEAEHVEPQAEGSASRVAVLIPLPYADDVDAVWQQQVETDGGQLLCHEQHESREALIPRLLQLVAPASPTEDSPESDSTTDPTSTQARRRELIADFHALGFAYLQTELLTRHMHYSTQMSESAFLESLLAAAQAVVQGAFESAQTSLQACFDLLAQERDHYYAVDVYLLDLALVAPGAIGPQVASELTGQVPTNLIVEAIQLEALAAETPQAAEAPPLVDRLKAAITERRVSILGGDYQALPSSLLPSDTLHYQLQLGLETFDRILGQRPQIYARRPFGLTPGLPQRLLKFGFDGAIHATFDGGHFPEANQSKSRWEGNGHFSIDAIMRAPLDATKPESFLKLAASLGNAIDSEHIATRCFVHWCGHQSRWYDELQRVAKRTSSLGRFVTVEEYFQDTYDPGLSDRFRADQYRSPLLADQVAADAADPISACTTYWRQYVWATQTVNACVLDLLLVNDAAARQRHQQACYQLESILNRGPFPRVVGDEEIEQHCLEQLHQIANSMANHLASQASSARQSDAQTGEPQGYLLLNPCHFPRRTLLHDSTITTGSEPPVYATNSPSEPPPHRIVADAPALGFAVVRSQTPTPPVQRGWRRPRQPPAVAEGEQLRNEFLDARIDPQTGALRGIRSFGSRVNRLSQLLVWESPSLPHPPGAQQQDSASVSRGRSRMVADLVKVTQADTVFGEIQATGRLLSHSDTILAHYTLTYQLERGSRALHVELNLDQVGELAGSPWTNYLGVRSAWPNEATEITRYLNDAHSPTTASRFEAPLYVHLDDGNEQTTLLTGGLPYHVRCSRRALDTLLLVPGETARTFHWAVGIDIKHPLNEAWSMLAPQHGFPIAGALPTQDTAWLLHLDARNVHATQWQPIWQDDQVIGLRVRLQETQGKPCRVRVQSLRCFASARKLDAWGVTTDHCEVSDHGLECRLNAYEQTDVEAMLKPA